MVETRSKSAWMPRSEAAGAGRREVSLSPGPGAGDSRGRGRVGRGLARRERSPMRRERSPMRRERISNRMDWSPRRGRKNPAGRERSPAGRGRSPAKRETSTSGRERSRARRGLSPAKRRERSPTKEKSPTKREKSPTGRESSPTGREISTSRRERSPAKRERIASGRETSPARRSISSFVRERRPDRSKRTPPMREPSSRSSGTRSGNYNPEIREESHDIRGRSPLTERGRSPLTERGRSPIARGERSYNRECSSKISRSRKSSRVRRSPNRSPEVLNDVREKIRLAGGVDWATSQEREGPQLQKDRLEILDRARSQRSFSPRQVIVGLVVDPRQKSLLHLRCPEWNRGKCSLGDLHIESVVGGPPVVMEHICSYCRSTEHRRKRCEKSRRRCEVKGSGEESEMVSCSEGESRNGEVVETDKNHNTCGSERKSIKSKNVSFVMAADALSADEIMNGKTNSVHFKKPHDGQKVGSTSSEKKDQDRKSNQKPTTAKAEYAEEKEEVSLKRLRLVVKMMKQTKEESIKNSRELDTLYKEIREIIPDSD